MQPVLGPANGDEGLRLASSEIVRVRLQDDDVFAVQACARGRRGAFLCRLCG